MDFLKVKFIINVLNPGKLLLKRKVDNDRFPSLKNNYFKFT